MYPSAEKRPGPSQASKISLLARLVEVFKLMLLTIFVKSTIMGGGSDYTSDYTFHERDHYHIETSLLICRAN